MCGQTMTEDRNVQPTTSKMVPTVTDATPFTTNHSAVMGLLGKLSHLRRLDIYTALHCVKHGSIFICLVCVQNVCVCIPRREINP